VTELEAARQRLAALESALGERNAELANLSEVAARAAAAEAQAASPTVALAEEVGGALADAAAAATRLGDALAKAAAVMLPSPPTQPPPAATPEAQPASAPAAPGRGGRPAASGSAAAAPARRPVPLPPAVFDDSVEAAEHLMRVPGVVLIVDGYNVSLAGWSELPLADQRRRLVGALAELAARTGADVRVVFDGSEMGSPGVVPTTAQAVRVSFSPPGVEADDVVIEAVGELPRHRPVVVASSDRRVQDGAAGAGANVISTAQLLSILRR
jgi:predicted RNA-binding protein with PIN domain